MKTKITSLILASLFGATIASQAAVITMPSGLSAGDQYRLVFVSSTTIDATSSDIDIYNAHVTAAAALNTDLATFAGTIEQTTTWTAMVSAGTTTALADNVRDNTSTTGAGTGIGIYTLDGASIATSYTDLWDNSLTNPLNINESGILLDTTVWTGSSASGITSSAGPLGSGTSRFGQSQRYSGNPTASWWFNRSGTTVQSTSRSLYAISGILTVPEPSSTALLGLGGLALMLRRKRS